MLAWDRVVFVVCSEMSGLAKFIQKMTLLMWEESISAVAWREKIIPVIGCVYIQQNEHEEIPATGTLNFSFGINCQSNINQRFVQRDSDDVMESLNKIKHQGKNKTYLNSNYVAHYQKLLHAEPSVCGLSAPPLKE